MEFVRMQKSIVQLCRQKVFRWTQFFWKMLEFFITLIYGATKEFLRIDKASLLETFGSLKITNFRYTPSCLQLLRKSVSSSSLLLLYSNFSCFPKFLTVTFPYFSAILLSIFITFLDSTKFKIVQIKTTTIFKRRVSIILWSFSS